MTNTQNCASKNERMVVNTQNTSPYATKNGRQVSLAHLGYISREERDIEIANNVSTELTVSVDDLWDLKKKLMKSDVGTQTRLLISKEFAYKHILKYFTEEDIIKVEDKDHEGLKFDSDARTTHELCFKRWNSTKSYIFNKNWRDFVIRRELNEGDEIGLFWNPYASRLHFSVLAYKH